MKLRELALRLLELVGYGAFAEDEVLVDVDGEDYLVVTDVQRQQLNGKTVTVIYTEKDEKER